MAHILLIEDDFVLRDITAVHLRNAGHTVTDAADGNEGLARYKAHEPDLVITDLVMRGDGGIGVIIALQRLSPAPRILVISGAPDSPSFLKMAQELGARRGLSKPFTRDSLLSAVNEVLSQPLNSISRNAR